MAAKINVIFSGNATFTIVSEKTNKHLTYKLEQSRKRSDTFFLKRLIGAENSDASAYLNIGLVNAKTNYIALAQKDSVAQWFFVHILEKGWDIKDFEEHGCRFLPATKCMRCGRKLTAPTSIDNALGPVCNGK